VKTTASLGLEGTTAPNRKAHQLDIYHRIGGAITLGPPMAKIYAALVKQVFDFFA
jgi:hypothetical protein